MQFISMYTFLYVYIYSKFVYLLTQKIRFIGSYGFVRWIRVVHTVSGSQCQDSRRLLRVAASLCFVSYNNGFYRISLQKKHHFSHRNTPFITPSALAVAIFPCPPLQHSYSGAISPSVSSSSPLSFSFKSPLVRPHPHHTTALCSARPPVTTVLEISSALTLHTEFNTTDYSFLRNRLLMWNLKCM